MEKLKYEFEFVCTLFDEVNITKKKQKKNSVNVSWERTFTSSIVPSVILREKNSQQKKYIPHRQ